MGVYETSALFIISILGVRDFFLSTFWSVTMGNIEQHPLSVTLKNYKLALLVGKKRETENVDHFCVFFDLFRERKLIKVFFRCFRYFFFLPGSCEPGGEKKLYFHCFFYYTLLTGEGKGVNRNFHFTLILYLLTYNFQKSIKACVNFLN